MVRQVGEWVDEKRGEGVGKKMREERLRVGEKQSNGRRAIMEPQRQASWGGEVRLASPTVGIKKKGKAA